MYFTSRQPVPFTLIMFNDYNVTGWLVIHWIQTIMMEETAP